jgi:hypothetical protein
MAVQVWVKTNGATGVVKSGVKNTVKKSVK